MIFPFVISRLTKPSLVRAPLVSTPLVLATNDTINLRNAVRDVYFNDAIKELKSKTVDYLSFHKELKNVKYSNEHFNFKKL